MNNRFLLLMLLLFSSSTFAQNVLTYDFRTTDIAGPTIEPSTNIIPEAMIRAYIETLRFGIEKQLEAADGLKTWDDKTFRDKLYQGIKNSGCTDPEIIEIIPALAYKESFLRAFVKSYSGPEGYFQFAYETAKKFGVIVNGVDYRSDLVKSAEGATKLLMYLKAKYKDIKLALWAYHIGEGTVSDAISLATSEGMRGVTMDMLNFLPSPNLFPNTYRFMKNLLAKDYSPMYPYSALASLAIFKDYMDDPVMELARIQEFQSGEKKPYKTRFDYGFAKYKPFSLEPNQPRMIVSQPKSGYVPGPSPQASGAYIMVITALNTHRTKHGQAKLSVLPGYFNTTETFNIALRSLSQTEQAQVWYVVRCLFRSGLLWYDDSNPGITIMPSTEGRTLSENLYKEIK